MTRSATEDGYVLPRTEAEYARLRMQAKAWEPVTLTLLKDAGLAPGMSCLDAGCGPGEAMRLMGRIVGPSGRVTGLDVDAALGTHMLAEIRREPGPQFDFVALDLTDDAEVPGAPFDLVFARLLLVHMTDPVAMVRRLAALVRPGGRLVLMDYDMSRLACRPEEPAFTRGFAVLTECFHRGGKHADCGLRLAGYLAAAGLPRPRGTRVETFYAPIAVLGPMLRAVLAGLAPAAAALGVATPEEMAATFAEMEAIERADADFALGPLMIGVWTTIG